MLISSCAERVEKLSSAEVLSNDFNMTIELPRSIPKDVTIYESSNTRIVIFSDNNSKMTFTSSNRIELCESINISDCTFKSIFENKMKDGFNDVYERVSKISTAGLQLVDARVNRGGVTFEAKNVDWLTTTSLVELNSDKQLTYRLDLYLNSSTNKNSYVSNVVFDTKLSSLLNTFLSNQSSFKELGNYLAKNGFRVHVSGSE